MNSLKKLKVYETPYGLAVFVIVFLWGTALMASSEQIVRLSPETINKSVNTQFDVSVLYDVSTGDNTLPGLGFRIHFDSSKLEFISASNIASGGASGVILPEDETPRKADYDSETDSVIVVAWYSTNSNFPNQSLPYKLLDLTFKVKTGIPESDTSINITFTSTSLNYVGTSENATVNIKTMPNVSWTTSSQPISENIGSVNITVQSSFAYDQNIVLPISVSGTAENTSDYYFSNQSIEIISGAVTATKTIEIISDDDIEEDETIILKLENPDNASVIAPDTQILTILNDDAIQSIPLYKGWNLFSFSINNVYYVSDSEELPELETLTNAEPVQLGSLKEAFASIEGCYDLVRSNDVNGIKTFNPLFPRNTLNYLATGNGYWIKIKDTENCSPSTLTFTGRFAEPADTLKLKTGWNLVGCWHTKFQYDTDEIPLFSVPDGITGKQVDSLSDVFYSINGSYSLIRNFDENGILTYNPLFPRNSLHYISPGYGYWIKIKEDQQQPIELYY